MADNHLLVSQQCSAWLAMSAQLTPLPGKPGQDPEEAAYSDAVNVIPTQARAIAAMLRETSDRASVSCAVPKTLNPTPDPYPNPWFSVRYGTMLARLAAAKLNQEL